jgi:hypothetical protein
VSPTVRNVLIVVAIAGAVFALPGGGDAAAFVGGLLSAGITATFAFIGAKLYRENRVAIFGLGDRYRGLFYGAGAAAIFAMAARAQMWETGAGLLAWFALIGAASYSLALVWRYYRSYSF